MQATRLVCIGAATSLLAVAAAGQPGHADYAVVDLGTLGGSSSTGNAINNAGWVMGNANLAGNETTHAAVWLFGLEADLGTLGGPNSAVGWPVRGKVISGFSETAATDPLNEQWSCSPFFPTADGHVCLGFRWQDGVMTALPTLGGTNGYAAGANHRGEIVGWAETTVQDPTCVAPQVLQLEAVLYTAAGAVHELPPLSGDSDGAAVAINDWGHVVGISGICDLAYGNFTAEHAVIWRHGVPSLIPTFGGQGWNTPTDINNLGQVVGFADLPGDVVNGVLTPNWVAFIWSAATGTQEIPPLAGDTNNIAYAINDHGQVVGQSFGGPEGSRAFIWENGKATDLNTRIPASAGLYLIYAEGINDSGQITGQACVSTNPNCSGATETPAFLATPGGGSGAAAPAGAVTVSHEVYARPWLRWGLGREAAAAGH